MEFSNEIIRSLGMTIIHSLWQGVVISALILFILGLGGKLNARFRYTVLFLGLMLLLAGFFITFFIIYRQNSFLSSWREASETVFSSQAHPLTADWLLSPARYTGWMFGLLELAYPMLACGWLAGFLIIGIKLAGGAMINRANLRKSLEAPADALQNMFDGIKGWLNIPFMVRLRVTSRRVSPMVIGFLKPMVIIPAAAVTGLSTEQVETVMIHELAHIRRFDHIWVILQAIAEQVLFFHPAAWFLLREINRERENCCDDFVVKTNFNTINYIKALTMIQEMNLNKPIPVNALTGTKQLLNRVRRLVKPEMKYSPAFKMTVLFLLFATVGVSAMTLILTGRPGELFHKNGTTGSMVSVNDLQPDTTDKKVMNGTVSTVTSEKSDGKTKKMKITFVNDTIREMTINGKPVKNDEMKNYEDEIRKVREQMEQSQAELEKAHRELEKTQLQLELARKEIEEARENIENPDLPELTWKFTDISPQPYIDGDKFGYEFRKFWQDEEFRNQMKKAQEEGRKALEEMRLKQKEYWESHQYEFREQMKKAREEAKRAFEEMKKNKELYFFNEIPYLHEFPPVPEFDLHVLPDVEMENLIPPIPDIQEPIHVEPEIQGEEAPEAPATPEPDESGSRNSKLKELEGVEL